MILPFLLSIAAGALCVIGLYYLYIFNAWAATKARDSVPTRYLPTGNTDDEHVQVLVLGDIGRSPRMQYHAISVAKLGKKVDLIGYKETARHPALIGKPEVELYALTPYPEWIQWGTLPLLSIPYKVIHQFGTLFYTLMYATPAAKWIIIQVSERSFSVQPDVPLLLTSNRTRRRSRHFMSRSSLPGCAVARS